jgi:hypothetical protein
MDLILPVNMNSYKTGDKSESAWNTQDMRNRLAKTEIKQLFPVCYYSVAETKNHTFLLYSFFHSDDTTHPNDMEGCMIILENNENGHTLLGMITIAHFKIPKYSYQNRLYSHSGDRLDELLVEEEKDELHPLVEQESGKHGMYGIGKNTPVELKIWRKLKIVIGRYEDKIVYYPGVAKNYDLTYLKKFKSTPHYPSFYYDLVNIHDNNDGLYHRKSTGANSTFESNGKFHGNAANPPWLWIDDGIKIWEKPSELAAKWFLTKSKPFEENYVKRMEDP